MQKKEQNTEEKPLNWKKEPLSWVQISVMAVIIAYALNTFTTANSRVLSASMGNTIMTKDRVIGSRLSYYFGDPQRDDIVIFYFPDDESLFYVKRIIGLPGDAINIKDGHIYSNSSETPLDESYLKEAMAVESDLHCEVPEDSYLMMDNNRNSPADFKRWRNTFAKRRKIIVKAMFRYWLSFGIVK